jgi:hypothetical protein
MWLDPVVDPPEHENEFLVTIKITELIEQLS